MIIPIIRRYYDEEVYLYAHKSIDLKPNTITYICGCNGYGKSTLLLQIEDYVDSKKAVNIVSYMTNPIARAFNKNALDVNVGYFKFDVDSRYYATEGQFLNSHAISMLQSNGESISHRYVTGLIYLKKWIQDKNNSGKTLFLFMDDLDAGTSLDMINDLKNVISMVVKECEDNNITFYGIAPINSYEFTYNNPYNSVCIDACTFKSMVFKSYTRYKNYVYKTRSKKNKRYKDE
jgi:energy-coupling factor transporter ATP-binding protein EcfA2